MLILRMAADGVICGLLSVAKLFVVVADIMAGRYGLGLPSFERLG